MPIQPNTKSIMINVRFVFLYYMQILGQLLPKKIQLENFISITIK